MGRAHAKVWGTVAWAALACASGAKAFDHEPPAKRRVQLVGLTTTVKALQEARYEQAHPKGDALDHDYVCGNDRLMELQREDDERTFFESERWTVDKRSVAPCKGKPARRATAEAREDDILDAANSALRKCMKVANEADELPIAFEIGTTGCVRAAVARTSSADPAVDKCVATALSLAAFAPRAEPQRTFWSVRARPEYRDAKEAVAAPQRLVAVRSQCTVQPSAATPDLPTYGEIGEAFDAMRPEIQRCMEQENVSGPIEIAFNVYGPTGHIVGAAAATEPRLPKLDACIANVLGWFCFFPFNAPAATRPYWSRRQEVSVGHPPEHEEQLADVRSSCRVRGLVPMRKPGRAVLDAELAIAMRLALPQIRGCFAKHGPPLSRPRGIDVALDSRTGGIVGVATDFIPRRPALDACIAETLGDTCVTSDASIQLGTRDFGRFLVEP